MSNKRIEIETKLPQSINAIENFGLVRKSNVILSTSS